MRKTVHDNDSYGTGGNSNDDGGIDGNDFLVNCVLMGEVIMLMIVMWKMRVMEVTLLIVMEVPKRK